jgi:predicted RNA-binding Zn ribbon-like protein
VNFDAYAHRAVDLVNAPLDDLDDLKCLLSSGHDAADWHMHVTGRGASVSTEYLAGGVWGLAVWLCEYGSARFGVCADERCGNVYLDTSSNCCRRFCSERCATRSHVAAHRARKRAAVEEAALTPVG